MRKKLILAMTCLVSAAAFGVTLEKKGDAWIVKSKGYTAHFEKSEGYRPRFSRLSGKKVPYSSATPQIFLSGERDKWVGQYAANVKAV